MVILSLTFIGKLHQSMDRVEARDIELTACVLIPAFPWRGNVQLDPAIAHRLCIFYESSAQPGRQPRDFPLEVEPEKLLRLGIGRGQQAVFPKADADLLSRFGYDKGIASNAAKRVFGLDKVLPRIEQRRRDGELPNLDRIPIEIHHRGRKSLVSEANRNPLLISFELIDSLGIFDP